MRFGLREFLGDLWHVLLNQVALVVAAGQLRLILIKETCPVCLVALTGCFQVLQLRENFDYLSEGRFHDEVDEADLTLCDVRCLSVKELAHRESMHLFKVTLREEFYKEQVAP